MAAATMRSRAPPSPFSLPRAGTLRASRVAILTPELNSIQYIRTRVGWEGIREGYENGTGGIHRLPCAGFAMAQGPFPGGLAGRIRPPRLRDLRARAGAGPGRGDPRRSRAVSRSRPEGPQRFRGTEDQPRLRAAYKVASVRRTRDPSARAFLRRSRAWAELPVVGLPRHQPASGRDGATLAHRRWRRAAATPASCARRQHVLGHRRHHRDEWQHRGHSRKSFVG